MDTLHTEWLNQNSLRAYPIREDCARIPNDSGGELLDAGLAIPNFVVVDFVATVPSDLSGDLYIDKLSYFGDFLNISIAADGMSIAIVAVDLASHTANTAYRFVCRGAYASAVGAIVIGDLSGLGDILPQGQYNYAASQTCFESCCVRPSIRGVSGISVQDASTGYTSKPLTGDVRLISGSNIEFKYSEEDNSITINAGDGLGYSEECECGDVTSKKISYLNGVSADRVSIVGEDCVSVTVSDGVIHIVDTCAKPCCGCAELAFINDKISEIQTAIGRLSGYATQLEAAQVRFDAMKALDTALN